MKIVLRLVRNFTIFVHLAYWRSETHSNCTILQAGYALGFAMHS